MLTKEQRAEINRRNAQKSTGPKTEEGKNRVRLNSTRHNITGQVIVMYEKDFEAYEQFKQSFHDTYQPEGPVETQLVQCMVDSSWKINECSAFQTRILAGGSVGRVDKYPAENNPQTNEAFATADVVIKMTKELANLSLYEQRHFRTFERSLDRLNTMQKERKENRAISINEAAALLDLHEHQEFERQEAREEEADIAARTGQPSPEPYIPQPNPPAHETVPAGLANKISEPALAINGFAFSIAEIKEHARRKQTLREALALPRTLDAAA